MTRTGRAHPIGHTVPAPSQLVRAPNTDRTSAQYHIAVASAVPGMGEAVTPPITGPPCLEPFGGTRLFENVADIGDQQCLRVIGKGLNHNIFHSEDLVKRIVLLARIYSFEIFDMVIPGRGNACTPRKSIPDNKKIAKRYLPVM